MIENCQDFDGVGDCKKAPACFTGITSKPIEVDKDCKMDSSHSSFPFSLFEVALRPRTREIK